MASSDRLSRLFSCLLVPLTAGCAERSEGEGEIEPSRFEDNLCDESGWNVLGAIEPADAVDYVELRRFETEGLLADDRLSITDSSGDRCGGASDPAACESAFEALPRESSFHVTSFDSNIYRSLAYRRADEVGAVVEHDQLRAFLGSIDAPGDAVLWASLKGHNVRCGPGNEVGPHDEGYVVHTVSGHGCPNDINEHMVLVRPDGTIEVLTTVLVERGDPGCAAGRLPAGLCRGRRPQVADPMGDFLAEVAHLEAAAVTAFDQLRQELAVHRAPRSMVAAADRARADEVRHARTMAAHARRYGGRPVAPKVAGWAPRSLEAIAVDNAAEGCVRETYGALVAHLQARRATDPALRRAFATIAREETRHASLSWGLHRWAQQRLSPAGRRRLRSRSAAALDRLQQELTSDEHPQVHAKAGMPTPTEARELFAALRRSQLDRVTA